MMAIAMATSATFTFITTPGTSTSWSRHLIMWGKEASQESYRMNPQLKAHTWAKAHWYRREELRGTDQVGLYEGR